jgi:RND family efflux transporter MFP subunit
MAAPISKNFLVLLLTLALLWVPAAAHGDEDHGDHSKPVAGVAKTATLSDAVKTGQGEFKVTLTRTPANPKVGEKVRLEFKLVEIVEGGLAGGELPLTDAHVSVGVRDERGRVVTAKIDVMKDGGPGSYAAQYVFDGGGAFTLAVSALTGDNRPVTVEFPMAVRAKPFNWFGFAAQLLITFLGMGLIARTFQSALAGGRGVLGAARGTVLPAITVIMASALMIYFSGRYLPSFAKPEAEPVEAASGPVDNIVEVAKEAQLQFGMITEESKRESLTRTIQVNGVVAFRTQFIAEVTPPVAGRLTDSRRFTIGDRIAAGTILAVVEQTLPAQDVAALEVNRIQIQTDRTRLESEISQNRNKLEQARVDLARAERLYELQASPLKDLQQSRLALALAEEDLKRATRQLETFKVTDRAVAPTRRFEIKAPLSGVIVETALTAGEYVEPSKPLMKVVDPNRVWIQANVYEVDLDAVRGSRSATFSVPSYPGETFRIDGGARGRLLTVGAAVDPKNRTVPVIFEVENPGGRLKDGMFATIRIDTRENRECVTVPRSAIYDDAGRKYFYIFRGGESFEQREATTGIETSERIEVKAGLNPGDRVVVQGLRQLRTVALQGGI